MINVFPPNPGFPDHSDDWQVWTDTSDGEHDGRCLGAGATKELALREALTELKADYETLKDRVIEELTK